jgi:outer membrane protein insertion porin family
MHSLFRFELLTLQALVKPINLFQHNRASYALLALLLVGFLQTTMAQVVTSDSSRLELSNPIQQEPQLFKLVKLQVTGLQTTNEPFVIASAGLQVGDSIRIPGPSISNAIKRIYRTGLYSDVKIFEIERTEKEISLEIRLREQPRLDGFELSGVKKSPRREIREKIPLLTGFGITQASKTQAESAIIRYYLEKGFRDTKVETKVQITDTLMNRAKLLFTIDPGRKLQIEKINIVGNEAIKDRLIKKKMKEVKENTWFRLAKQIYKKDKYEEAKENLVKLYKSKGYRDIQVVSDSIYVKKFGKKDGLQIDIKVLEGNKYYVRNINWDGNTIYTDERLTQSLGFKKGDVFNETLYDENLVQNKEGTDVSSLYQNIGYLFFQLEKNVDLVAPDSVDLNFFIIEDEIATLVNVDFKGNTRTHDNVIRRELRTYPGEIYSREAIMRSIRQLQTLTYFVPEKFDTNLDYDYEAKKVSITYILEETTGTDNFELSGGFGGRGIGMILSARVNFNNFSIQNAFNKDSYQILPTGDGQKLSVGIQVTGRGYQNYDVSFTEPWFNGKPTSLGFSTSYSLYSTSTFRYELFSSSVSVGRRLTWPDDYFSQSNALILQKYNVDDPDGTVYGNSGNTFLLSYRSILERNSLDNFISPNNGSKFTLQLDLAPPVFSFSEYYKLKIKYQYHIPIISKLVMTYGLEWGHLGWFTEDRRSQFQRFYMGGTPLQQRQSFTNDNIDLRGFPGGLGGSITPYQDGQPIGGRIYNKYFAEARYPLVSNAQLQLIPYMFAEAGNVYRNFSSYDPFDNKRATGFGARIFLPILGLVDLSYGYRFDGVPGSSIAPRKWEFLFNIGAPF